MNKYFIFVILLALTFVYGCSSSNTQPVSVKETVVTFVVDCTDSELFESIDQDFRTNLNSFFQNTKLNQMDYGQKLTVKMVPLEESGTVSSKKASIGPANKRMSKREAAACCDSRPLLQLISSELNAYKTLSETNLQSSPIMETLLKSFIETDAESEREIIVVLTDGIEHSAYQNMYKTIPTKEEAIDKLVDKIDPILLKDATNRIHQTMPFVIVVLKKSEKASTSDLKQFYCQFFSKLGIQSSDVLFVDNLGNNIIITEL